MKVKELLPILRRGAKIAKKKAVIPILEDAWVADGKIHFCNLRTTLTTEFETGYEGMFPLHPVLKLVANLHKDSEVGFTRPAADLNQMSLSVDGSAVAQWNSLDDPVDFPKTPEIDKGGALMTIGADDIRIIKAIAPLTSTDQLRPAMEGINLDNGHAQVTDGHVAGDLPISFNPCQLTPSNFIIPIADLRHILKLEDYQLEVNETNIKLTSKKDTIVSRLIGERFPGVKNIWPHIPEAAIIIKIYKKDQFVRILNCALAISNPYTHQISLSINEGKVKIKAEDLDFNSSYTNALTADITVNSSVSNSPGETLQIGFNARNFLDVLKASDKDDIILHIFAPNKGMLVDKYFIVMPVMLHYYEL